MSFRAGNHPESWSLSREAEHAFLCNDLAAARKDEWDFPAREPIEATAPDQTGEMTLPRLEVVA